MHTFKLIVINSQMSEKKAAQFNAFTTLIEKQQPLAQRKPILLYELSLSKF